MKIPVPFMVLCVFILTLSTACTSKPKVKRVDPDTQIDLSGYWNDTDVRIVCEGLIQDCVAAPRVGQIGAQKGMLPVIIVGNFRNDSDEHIDTSIIARRMEAAILNSGKAEFVAGGDTRSDIRAERQDQQSWASEKTVKALASETGADFYLSGSVNTIVDRAGNSVTRTYFVFAELTEIESGRRVWIGENSEIKKLIKNPQVKM